MTLEERVEDSFEQYRTKDIDYVVSPYSEDNGTKKLMFNNEYDAEEEYFRFYKQGFLAGVEEVKADCDFVLEGKDVEIKELEQKLEQTEKDLADYQFNYPTIKELEKEIKELRGQLKEQTHFAKTYYEEIIKLHEQIESKDKFIADLEESNNAGSVYISNLENQIEKMQNCNNCEHYTWNMSNEKCHFRCESRKACVNWKMKE